MNEKKNDYKYPEVNQDTPWPSIEFPYVEGQPIIVMIAGFPDHCTSGFGKVLDELLRAEKYHIICLCLPDFQSNCQKPKPWVIFITLLFIIIIIITIIITITRVILQLNYYLYYDKLFNIMLKMINKKFP